MSDYELMESGQSVKTQHYNEQLARLNGVLEEKIHFSWQLTVIFFYFLRCK